MMHTTYSHLPVYLLGVLVADRVADVKAHPESHAWIRGKKRLLILFFVGNSISLLSSASLPFMLDGLRHQAQRLPDSRVWGGSMSWKELAIRLAIAVYIPARKLALVLTIACSVFCFALRGSLLQCMLSVGHSFPKATRLATKGSEDARAAAETSWRAQRRCSLMVILSRVAFTVFLINLFVIRLDFYSSRHVTTDYPLTMVRRIVSLAFYVLLTSVLLHLLFIQPLDRVRRMCLSACLSQGKAGPAIRASDRD